MTHNVTVCVGSSCHLKGSYEILQTFKRLVAETGADVALGASFCLGHCAEGVSVKVDEEIHTGVSPDNAEAFFRTVILA